jgi:GT2 family glycosyltransferase
MRKLMNAASPANPKISVVVLNYNGQPWLPRCFESLEKQTIFGDVETIVVDNCSPDGSARLAAEWFERGHKGRLIQNKENLYFCEANNVGARVASGEFLLFLNNDTWLEPDCLERLLRETEAAGADTATPMVLNYEDNSFQSIGGPGLDLFGLPVGYARGFSNTSEIFAAPGCSFFIKAEMFERVGGFDAGLLMYADEVDLSWRVQIAGGKIVGVPSARVHHRGAATANPEGRTRVVESRTSETKRYLANRNGLLVVMKNAHTVMLGMVLTHLLLLLVESLAALLLVRRWGYVRKSYYGAAWDAFRMGGHVREWRRRIAGFRRHGDFWMLRYICLVPSRLGEVRRLFRQGVPKVDER